VVIFGGGCHSGPNPTGKFSGLGLTVPFDFFLPRWTVPLKTVELQDAQQGTA
jgi:hypothetical protein